MTHHEIATHFHFLHSMFAPILGPRPRTTMRFADVPDDRTDTHGPAPTTRKQWFEQISRMADSTIIAARLLPEELRTRGGRAILDALSATKEAMFGWEVSDERRGRLWEELTSVKNAVAHLAEEPPRAVAANAKAAAKPTRKHRQREPAKRLTSKQLVAAEVFGNCQSNYSATARKLGLSRSATKDRIDAGYKKLGQK
ncbi:MAG TPA: hypothetical protein VFC78_24665, partial [Tepidisphaeraceae bacterium]|nr:hypothetical protein [Tepidisphaeraceae bacterium]